MPTTAASGLRIHYELAGTPEGPPIVLVHGYTANANTQWKIPGWVDFLAPRHRILLVDLRGHGKSEKPHEREKYSLALMAADVLAAMDAAAIPRADVMGYSMGSMVTMELLLEHGQRFDRAVLGGMGAEFPRSGADSCREEESGPIPPNPISFGRWTRTSLSFMRHYDFFALRALAKSVFEGSRPVDPARLHEIKQPVLSVVGTRDRFCAGTRLLAERIPDCRRITLSGRGHVAAVRDPRFKEAVGAFLADG